MRHISGQSRQQIILFPECINDYIPEGCQVRFIDEFVDALDMVYLGYSKAQTRETGRKPYHPGDLLKLYLYGYLHRIRSSRNLEKETRRNIEVMWLIKRLKPNFKTISDFRKDNSKALEKTFTYFMKICRQAGLYKGEILAIDGSYFKAINSKDKVLTKKKLELQLSNIEKSIRDYLEEMDRIDQEEDALYGDIEEQPDPEKLRQIIDTLKKDKALKLHQLQELSDSGKEQSSLTDKDSHLMQKRNGPPVVGYNVQTAVDEEHKLVVAYDITSNANDKTHLLPMVCKIVGDKENVTKQVVADSGYYNGEHIFEVEKLGVETYIPHVNTSSSKSHNRYDKEQFVYLDQHDAYQCPSGKILERSYKEKTGLKRSFYRTKSCKQCQQRSACTTNKTGRVIYRYEYEAAVERMKKRNKENPGAQKRRKALVEHPYGTLKHNWGYDHFLLKGKEKVSGEMGLMLLAYNMKRTMNILGKAAVRKLVSV